MGIDFLNFGYMASKKINVVMLSNTFLLYKLLYKSHLYNTAPLLVFFP